ncbi:MAG: J domain-containing protein [Thermoleophilaceae bacterium]|nr:J domain-containing protein [Thermoleophilaceae bacterium]
MTEDPYEILGVARDATEDEVRAAYIAGAKRSHPDVVGEAESGERMRQLNLAYEVLRDPELRVLYDAEHRVGRGIHSDLEDIVRVWVEDGRLDDPAIEKLAALNREMVRMENEGWDVRRHHDHLVCTRTDRKGMFGRAIKRRVTVNIDKHGLPFHVEQKRPD